MKKILNKYHYFILVLVIAFAFLTRAYKVHLPEVYIFDEVYHAVTSKLIARNDPWAYEWDNPPVEKNTAVDWLHPPYAKYTQAFFILMFGENTFGWRISSVVFGVLVIVMVYKLSYELFTNKNISLLATFLASLDGLLLVQSRIAMNDIHVTFFILLTFLIYLRYRKSQKSYLLLIASLCSGLAMGTKWSGLFALVTIVFFEGFYFLSDWKKTHTWPLTKNKFVLYSISFFVLPILIYLASYTHMFMQGKSLFCFENRVIENVCYKEKLKFGPYTFDGYVSHFAELHRQIWWYQTGLTATHGYQSRPLQWFLNLRPVWFHVEYKKNYLTNIYSQGNTMLFWLGDLAILISVFILTTRLFVQSFLMAIKKLKLKISKKVLTPVKQLLEFKLPKYFFFLIFTYFIVWLPWQISPRIMFFYHYTPAVPLLAIILAYWLNQISGYKVKGIALGKILVTFALVACSLNFVLFYPNWTGLTVPEKIFKPLYFALKSWK